MRLSLARVPRPILRQSCNVALRPRAGCTPKGCSVGTGTLIGKEKAQRDNHAAAIPCQVHSAFQFRCVKLSDRIQCARAFDWALRAIQVGHSSRHFMLWFLTVRQFLGTWGSVGAALVRRDASVGCHSQFAQPQLSRASLVQVRGTSPR